MINHTLPTSSGPNVVAIGGGHGLSTLLRGLKQHTDRLTAVVTVADDGGSSGQLRRGMGMLPLVICDVASPLWPRPSPL